MHRAVPRATLALAGALLALGPFAAVGSASPSAPTAGACQDETGITVVVDATAFGRGVQVRCAPQPVRSGFEALRRAGFSYQGTTQYPGLLCRIDGEPASDPCHGAPPPNAYWAYWHAPRGGEWTYSTSGAGGRVPPPGSVEGWAFGDDAQPRVDPPAAPPATTTTSPHPVTTQPRSSSPVPSAARGTSTTVREGAADTAPSTTAAGDEPTTTTTSVRVADGEGGSDGGSDEQAGAVPAASDPGTGSPAGAIAGLAGVVALGTAAFVMARRRHALEEGPS